ncbi:hypothetical protein [Actinoplanes sp. NPDC023714]|uniref:hypothetical protein n=1 Tax=Actinoplanes sp. NPDC023714 TaxID=3154322 RepID=UPI0033F0A1F4
MGVVFDRPVRDIDVRAGSQLHCAGFAGILADVEPADRFEFVDAHESQGTGSDDGELVEACVNAVRRGVLGELGEPLPPVRFVLRRILIHLVDSTEDRNEAAGRLAVAEAKRRLGAVSRPEGTPPP